MKILVSIILISCVSGKKIVNEGAELDISSAYEYLSNYKIINDSIKVSNTIINKAKLKILVNIPNKNFFDWGFYVKEKQIYVQHRGRQPKLERKQVIINPNDSLKFIFSEKVYTDILKETIKTNTEIYFKSIIWNTTKSNINDTIINIEKFISIPILLDD